MKQKSRFGKIAAAVVALVLLGAGIVVYQRMRPDATTAAESEQASGAAEVTAPEGVPVVLQAAERRTFRESIEVQGNLQARNFALVSPKIGGVLDAVYVDEGDQVIAGETPLFQSDSVKLQKAIDIAEQNLKVARLARVESQANLRRTEAELAKIASDYRRYKSLHERGVVSEGAYEEIASAYEQAQAMETHAESVVAVADEQAQSAEIALTLAEQDLRDSLMIAPLSGTVSARMAEPGENGAVGTPVLRIDDVENLEASTYLPGQYYGRVVPGTTPVRIGAEGSWWGDYGIRYKSPTVDPGLRTFEIRCDVPGDGERAVPGVLVQMLVVLEEREGLGVPTNAIVQRADRRVVFVVDNGTAAMRVVEVGLATDGWSEVTGGELKPDDRVVVQGQFLLDDGSAVRQQEGAE